MKWRDVVSAYPAKGSLEISERYALFPEDEDQAPLIAWPQQYPHSDKRGVYLDPVESGGSPQYWRYGVPLVHWQGCQATAG